MHTCMLSESWVSLMLECTHIYVYGVTIDSVRPICSEMKSVFVGRTGRVVRGNTVKLAGELNIYCSLEADEGGVDLAYTGQCQHDLSPILWILL